jgi:hypothetical protein
MDATNRRLREVTKSLILVIATAAGSLLANALPASAQVPPFTQCPPVGMDTSCAVLIVYNPDGSRVTLVDPSQPPYDGVEDTLIGVQNNSTVPVPSLTLTGFGVIPIFGFDGDGLCAPFTSPKPAGCPYGPTGYEGRGSSTAIASTAPGPGNTFTGISPNMQTGTVNFNPPIPPGGSAYFSLEGPAASVAPPLPPSMLTLMPVAAVNTVGTKHTVTATVTNSVGNPVQGIVVIFTVTGSVNTTGSCTTNTSGQCSFTYNGPALPGGDLIQAFADTNKNGKQDMGEPVAKATKVWALPPSTALCEVDVTYGGWIHANNGDRANFGGNAKVDKDNNPEGQEEYQDQGPVMPMNVHSTNVLSVVCPSTTTATIFGEATIDGSGTYVYRIDVEDINEPGKGFDKYQIRLSNGYDSGRQTLEGGNIQIHKP